MSSDLDLFVHGLVAVIEAALLLAMLERPNRQHVPSWLLLLTSGALLWNGGAFVHVLVRDGASVWTARINQNAMVVMSLGVLMMPSGMLHGAIRLFRTGPTAGSPVDYRYLACWLPALILIPVGSHIYGADPHVPYLDAVAPFQWPYLLWMTSVNLIAAGIFLTIGRRFDLPKAGMFFQWMGWALIAISVAVVVVVEVAAGLWPSAAPMFRLLAGATPVLPAAIFAWFVARYRLVPLVLERTLVYSAILVGLLLFHRVAFRDMTDSLSERFRVDFAIIEALLGLCLILGWTPLRKRLTEALGYLLGAEVHGVRTKSQRLAVELAERIESPPERILKWLTRAVHRTFAVEYVGVWLFGADGQLVCQDGCQADVNEDDIRSVCDSLASTDRRFLARRDSIEPEISELFDRIACTLAVDVQHGEVGGVMLVGRRTFNQDLSAEEISTLVLLGEQLAVTLHNSSLQARRLAAERHALQQEKLSTLGLLAGSIAHEVRNPLSSIKTIATVLAEDLKDNSDHVEDLRLIVSEVERLTATTTQLLEFARPSQNGIGTCQPQRVLDRILRVVEHAARQKRIELDVIPAAEDLVVAADDDSVSQVFFNLLSNAVQAVPEGGEVRVKAIVDNGAFVATVADNGPGIPANVQNRLFEPFATSREGGTGLGLYVVASRMRECGGEIQCESSPQNGTAFTVRFPTVRQSRNGLSDQ